MGLFRRHLPPPAAVAGVTPGERVLAWAPCDDGGYVVATDRALYIPARDGESHRIGWEHVDRAAWHRDEAVLSITEALPGVRAYRHRLPVEDPGDLTVVVRERVNATVVNSRHVPLDGDRGVTIVARRPPGASALAWTVRLDRGIDRGDPRTQAAIDAALAEARAELGE